MRSFFDRQKPICLADLRSAKEDFIHYTYLELTKDVMDLIPKHAQLILDVGCGGGIFEELLSQFRFTGYKIGVDISKERIKLAHSKHIRNSSFIYGDAENLPFKDGLFDCILLIEVIEHISRKERVLKELRRVLREGGQITMTTPNKECISLRIHNKMQQQVISIARLVGRGFPPEHVNEYMSEKQLSELVRQIGFQVKGSINYIKPVALNLLGKVFGIFPPLPPFLYFRFYKSLRRIEKEYNFPYNLKDFFHGRSL